MCQGPTAVEALGGSICAALFRDIKPGALDSLDKPALLRTSKKLLAAGLKELENKEEKQRQRRNALHKHRKQWLPANADKAAIAIVAAFLINDADADVAAKGDARATARAGRGYEQRKEKFIKIVKSLCNGELQKMMDDDTLRRRGLSAVTAAKLVDAGSINYCALSAARKAMGDTGTLAKRNRRPCALPTAHLVQIKNGVLDKAVLRLGLICRTDGELWQPKLEMFMESTLYLRRYAEAYAKSPCSGTWRPLVGPHSGTGPIPMTIQIWGDGIPLETGSGGTGIYAFGLKHVDPRLGYGIRESPQQSDQVQISVLFPTKTRKRRLRDRAVLAQREAVDASDGEDDEEDPIYVEAVEDTLVDDADEVVHGTEDHEHDDDFQGFFDDEGEGDLLPTGKLLKARDVIGSNCGATLRCMLGNERTSWSTPTPWKCCVCADKPGQYELGAYAGSTTGYYRCNLCACPTHASGKGQPGGCWRCRRDGTVDTCSHWDLAVPDTLEFFEKQKRDLTAKIGPFPPEIAPYWRNGTEARQVARDLNIKLPSNATLETVEAAIIDKCNCLVATGSPQSQRHVRSAPNTHVLRDARRWAKAAHATEPARPQSAADWKRLRDQLHERLVNVTRLHLVEQILRFWDRLAPAERTSAVTRSGHIVDVSRFIDCSMHLTLRVVVHVLGLLYKEALDARSGLAPGEIKRRLDCASAAIRTAIKSETFTHRKKNGNDTSAYRPGTQIRTFSISGGVARKITRAKVHVDEENIMIGVTHADGRRSVIRGLEDGVAPTVEDFHAATARTLLEHVAEILLDDFPKLATVLKFLRELDYILKIINTRDWENDSATPRKFQERVDVAFRYFKDVWGDGPVTPYLHDIFSGHIRDMFDLWGPICRLSNEASERLGGQGIVRYDKRHGQNGGHKKSREGVVARAAKLESAGMWCGRHAIRGAERDEEFLAQDEELRKDKRTASYAAAGAKRRLRNIDQRAAATGPAAGPVEDMETG